MRLSVIHIIDVLTHCQLLDPNDIVTSITTDDNGLHIKGSGYDSKSNKNTEIDINLNEQAVYSLCSESAKEEYVGNKTIIS